MDAIPDKPARELAETTFDRNVVVVAGAGTGKTTLLVNRLVHALMKEPDPVPMTHLVALTFTNKAATEMKVRLRERLQVLAHPEAASPSDGGAVSLRDVRERYGLSTSEVAARASAALEDLEKAQIGTLHSFAAHLLRLYPLEGGVDPAFQEDDGLRFEEHFTAAWDLWLDRELSRQGTHHHLWQAILDVTTVDHLRELVRALCSELVELEVLRQQLDEAGLNPVAAEWVRQCQKRAQGLLESHDRPKRRKIEQMLAATSTLLQHVAEQGLAGLQTVGGEAREWLAKDPKGAVAGWDDEALDEAIHIVNISQELLSVNVDTFKYILKLVAPLVQDIRSSFSHQGWVSFDGLLAKARALLRDHPAVREQVKRDYRAVLVDEFQDTDPVQYEIILAACERQGSGAPDWREMKLEPGKLFIVGDPKQSIYAFRRADIEAFDRVVEKIAQEGGLVETLHTNFRSDASVLDPVNEIFDRLFQRQPLVQPANVRLEAPPQRSRSLGDAGVQFHITVPRDGEEAFKTEEASRAESEALARWIKEEVLARPHLKAGQIALLFRKLTQADLYLNALRRHDIQYVIDGEKHFYRRQEVIDLINLLRVLDHPHDSVALAGLLRSPLGGLTDRDLYDVRQAGLFNYLEAGRVAAWNHPAAPAVQRLYGQLAQLHRAVGRLPLGDAIQQLFDRLPLLDIAASGLDGEQAVANLLKVKQTAASLSDRPHLTLSGFVELMAGRIEEQPDEAESPLSEETSDAVRILTIHKAKGLEFPVVILPGLHQGSGRERALPAVSYDWSSGLYGLSLSGQHTLGAVLVREKLAIREAAERRRVLYVGMTRAQELLVLSGGATATARGETVLELLQDIAAGTIGDAGTTSVAIGLSQIPHRAIEAPEHARRRRPFAGASEGPPVDVAEVAARWDDRQARWAHARGTALFLTPTGMGQQPIGPGPASASKAAQDRDTGRLIGVVAHRMLEQWDFTASPAGLLDRITPTLQGLAEAGGEERHTIIRTSLETLFTTFGRSDLYALLRRAVILGREVPFLIPWGDGQVLEGVIDVLYRLDGRLWIADYKTDTVTADEAVARAERYRTQAMLYRRAVAQSLGVADVSCALLFLRAGLSVELV